MRILWLLLICVWPAWGQGLGLSETGSDHVKPSLHLEHTQVAPGTTTTLAVRFALSEAWHLYYSNPGDSGDAPAVELKLPAGVTAGEVQWPLPTRHVLPGELLAHLYEGELVLLIPLAVGKDVAPGALEFKAELGWLVCKEVCLMGDAELSATFSVGAPALNADAKPLFSKARAALPRKPKPEELEASWEGGALTLRVAGATELVFFPESEPAAAELLKHGKATADQLTVRFPGLPAIPTTIRGLLRVTRDGTTEGLRVDVPTPARTN